MRKIIRRIIYYDWHMYSPRPIRFSAHWCASYSKYRGFLAGGISNASSPLPILDRGSAAKTLITQYRQVDDDVTECKRLISLTMKNFFVLSDLFEWKNTYFPYEIIQLSTWMRWPSPSVCQSLDFEKGTFWCDGCFPDKVYFLYITDIRFCLT